MQSLSHKVSQGLLWVTLGGVTSNLVNIVAAVSLALLVPVAEFGIIAIALAVVEFAQATTITGFDSALIQKEKDPHAYLNTAWTFELLRHILLYAILYALAPFLAHFYENPEILPILRTIGLAFIIQGLRNVGIVFFRRDLEFRKNFIIIILPPLVNLLVAVPFAWQLKSAWALVYGYLGSKIGLTICSYIVHAYRPRLEFDWQKARELFNFAIWIFFSSILTVFKSQGLILFLGKFFGMAAPGYFNRASEFSDKIFRQMILIVWMVGYSLYARLQTTPELLKQTYLKTLKLYAFFTVPVAVMIFILCGDFVALFLGEAWLPIVPIIRLLCLRGIINFVVTPSEIIFQAVGKPAVNTRFMFANVLVLSALLFPFALKWGIAGAIAAIVVSDFLLAPIWWWQIRRELSCSFFEILQPVLFVLAASLCMIVIVVASQHVFADVMGKLVLMMISIAGAAGYLAVAYFLDKYLKFGIYHLVARRIGALAMTHAENV